MNNTIGAGPTYVNCEAPTLRHRFNRVISNMKVRWRNWKVRATAKAYSTMCKAMQDDPSYAMTWQCNITMTIYDRAEGKITVKEADVIADALMAHLFQVKKSK